MLKACIIHLRDKIICIFVVGKITKIHVYMEVLVLEYLGQTLSLLNRII